MIDQLNSIDEALTIGTLPDYAVVAPKDLIATIKIIPFSVPGTVLTVAETLARQNGSPLTLYPFQHLQVGLVATELPGLKDSTTDKTIAVTEQRITQLTGSLLPPVRCPHDEESVAPALEGLLAAGADMLLVVGASAVLDRRDVGPAGIVRAGGEIVHFGMPVDPGQSDLRWPDQGQTGVGAARLRAQPEAERHRLHPDPAVRRTEGDRPGHHAHGRWRIVEGVRQPSAAAGKGAGDAAVGCGAAQRADDRRDRYGGGPVPPHGAAQQAAGDRPVRQNR